jgi:hypothetical protein
MSDKLRWGIAGTGGIAHAFARDLLLDRHVLAAVGSRAQPTADAFAREFALPTAHSSYEALAKDPTRTSSTSPRRMPRTAPTRPWLCGSASTCRRRRPSRSTRRRPGT